MRWYMDSNPASVYVKTNRRFYMNVLVFENWTTEIGIGLADNVKQFTVHDADVTIHVIDNTGKIISVVHRQLAENRVVWERKHNFIAKRIVVIRRWGYKQYSSNHGVRVQGYTKRLYIRRRCMKTFAILQLFWLGIKIWSNARRFNWFRLYWQIWTGVEEWWYFWDCWHDSVGNFVRNRVINTT